MTYRARLFRGWETVNPEYRLDNDSIVMRRKGTWGRAQEQRAPERRDSIDEPLACR